MPPVASTLVNDPAPPSIPTYSLCYSFTPSYRHQANGTSRTTRRMRDSCFDTSLAQSVFLCARMRHPSAGSSGSFAFTAARQRFGTISMMCALLEASRCEG